MIQYRRILLFGADGHVGQELQRSFSDAGRVIALNHRQADLNHPEQLREVVRAAAPDLILNAAVYTAVDGAEEAPASAFSINSHAVRVLTEEANWPGSGPSRICVASTPFFERLGCTVHAARISFTQCCASPVT